MFYYVEGTVAALQPGLAVIDCAGVGYACNTSQTTISGLTIGKKAKLYTYLNVGESIFDLYGFADQEELNCFQMLLSVSGVGPKAALAILSTAPTSQVALSIITGDAKLLTRAPGVGKKIAQRICLELKDKLAKEQDKGSFANIPVTVPVSSDSTAAVSEAVSALMVLGYSQSEAMDAMNGISIENATAEEIIRACLKKLAAQ